MYEGKTNPILDAFIIEVKDANNVKKLNAQIHDMKGIVKASYGDVYKRQASYHSNNACTKCCLSCFSFMVVL